MPTIEIDEIIPQNIVVSSTGPDSERLKRLKTEFQMEEFSGTDPTLRSIISE